MSRTGSVCGNEWQRNFGFLHAGQLALGFLGRLLEPLQRHFVAGKIDPLVLFKLVDDPIDDPLVDVVSTQMRIPVRRLHLDDAFAHLEDRNIERAAAKVVDRNRLVPFLVQTIRQRGGGGFVDNTKNLEAGDPASVFSGLPLRIVEISGDRNDGLLDLLSQISFCRLF